MEKESLIYLYGSQRSNVLEKLKTIDICGLSGTPQILDECHNVFKQTLKSKTTRPKLGGKDIFITFNWIENKAEIFWHVASIEKKAERDIKIQPCINDIASAMCNNNCITGSDHIILSDGDEREKCIYRAMRIGWIKEIIDLYNNGDARVRYWEKVNSKKRNRIYLRYQEEEIDYIVVLDEKNANRVMLITAFPVFFISAKRDYDKDYRNFCNK